MESDIGFLKSFMTAVSGPIMFVLGLIGWHYRGVNGKVNDLTSSCEDLRVQVGQHGVHVQHLHDCIHKLDKKVDILLESLTSGRKNRSKI